MPSPLLVTVPPSVLVVSKLVMVAPSTTVSLSNTLPVVTAVSSVVLAVSGDATGLPSSVTVIVTVVVEQVGVCDQML